MVISLALIGMGGWVLCSVIACLLLVVDAHECTNMTRDAEFPKTGRDGEARREQQRHTAKAFKNQLVGW